MMKEGARGFLLREHVEADLIKCIRVVARGELWLSTNLIGRVFDELLRRECEENTCSNHFPTAINWPK